MSADKPVPAATMREAAEVWSTLPKEAAGITAIACALMAAEDRQREKDAKIADTRFQNCLEQLPPDGDAYWQGAGSSAQIIASAIRNGG